MSKFSVKKPLTVFVVVIIVVVLGFISFTTMTPELFPNIELPYVMVTVPYPGATPEEVEDNVTIPLEQTLSIVENLSSISSQSNENYSMITMEFHDGTDLNAVTVDILQSVSLVEGEFDEMVGTPIIMKLNPDMLPVAVAAVDMEGMDSIELSKFTDETLLPRLEGITGIASVTTTGLVYENIKIDISDEKLEEVNEKIRSAIDASFEETQEELDEAKTEAEDGKSEIEDGQAELDSGKDEFADGMVQAEEEIVKQQSQLADTKVQLEAQIGEMEAQLAELNTTRATLEGLQTSLAEVQTTIEQAQASIARLNEIKVELVTLDATNAAFEEQVRVINEDPELTEEQKQAMVQAIYSSEEYLQMQAQYATIDAQLAALFLNRDNIDTGITVLEATLAVAQTSLDELKVVLAQQGVDPETLGQSIAEIDVGIAQIEEGIALLEQSIVDLEAGNIQLEQAFAQIEAQKIITTFELSDATAQLIVAEAGLEQALTQIDEGLEQIEDAKEDAYKQADIRDIITKEMVSNIIMVQDFAMPAGYVSEGLQEYLVSVGDKITSVEELEGLMLMDMGLDDVEPFYVAEVAKIYIADNWGLVYANINESDSVIFSFQKQSDAATSAACINITDEFAQLEEEYEGLSFTSLMDQGNYIVLMVGSVTESLMYGALFAVLILFLFLRDLKPTVITMLSIPVSVIFAFVLMYFSGVTLNIISMSGLAVGVGMLVDNSVVVLENIYRLRAKGYSAVKASISGASQVAGAITASTLTTVSVFLPIVFVEGITRQLFTDMALTVGYSLLASLIVALTLVPAMSSFMFKKSKERKPGIFEKMLGFYERTVRFTLRHRIMTLLVVAALLVGSIMITLARGFTFMPEMSGTSEMSATFTMPEGLAMDEMKEISDEAIEKILEVEEVHTVGASMSTSGMFGLISTGSDTPSINVYILINSSDRSTTQITDDIMERTQDVNCTVEVAGSSMATSTTAMFGGEGVSINVYNNDLDMLQEAASLLGSELEAVPGIADVDNGLKELDDTINIAVDKNKAMEQGLTTAQIYADIAALLTQENTTNSISTGEHDYEIVITQGTEDEFTPALIQDHEFTVTNREGDEEQVKLTDIATIEDSTSLASINRSEQRRRLQVQTGIEDGYNVTLVTEDAIAALEGIELPPGTTFSFQGQNEMIMDSMEDLILMVALGILFVYLIMVAQFQSWKLPFIVMFTIPLAATGGFAALLISGLELSVVSMVGFVMLVGIIVNNGIVLVDYINRLRIKGTERREAIVEAGRTRMRPILMTSITTILGLSIMALGIGNGTELMQPVAIVCIGGLAYATLLTLYVLPIMYDLVNKKAPRIIEKEDLEIVRDDEA